MSTAAGANLRLTEFQGALLLAQMSASSGNRSVREENAQYLTGMLEKIPGIRPVRNYPGCTRSAWHLYMLRYDPRHSPGVARHVPSSALAAEGVRGLERLHSAQQGAVHQNDGDIEGIPQDLFPEKLLEEWEERNAAR